jgi:branched-subunit amino acid ABC-type transport system permease component
MTVREVTAFLPRMRPVTVIASVSVLLIAAALIWDYVAESLVIGLTEHAPLVLAAMGFALLYRLTGLINVAYAETVTLGAYFGMVLNNNYGWGFYTVLVPAGILAGLVSVATYFGIFRPAKQMNVGVLEMIIISFGLSIFLRHSLQFVFGYPHRYYEVSFGDPIRVLDVGVAWYRLWALFSVLALALLLYWFIQKSRLGLQIRALASDEDLAQVSGIRPLLVTVLIWFIAGVAGGFAGAFYGVGSAVRPLLGWNQFLFILLVVLVGGARNIGGVIIAGIGTGIALAAMTLQFPQTLYANLVLIVAFVIILKVRGSRVTEAGKV